MKSMIILALCMSYAHTMIMALSWTSYAHTYHVWPLSWSLIIGWAQRKCYVPKNLCLDYVCCSQRCSLPKLFQVWFFDKLSPLARVCPVKCANMYTIMCQYEQICAKSWASFTNFSLNKSLFVQIAPSVCKVSERRPLLAFRQYIIHRHQSE